MKLTLAAIAILALSGCASVTEYVDNYKYDPHWVSKNVGVGGRSSFSHTMATPSGTYTVRGSAATSTRIYRVDK